MPEPTKIPESEVELDNKILTPTFDTSSRKEIVVREDEKGRKIPIIITTSLPLKNLIDEDLIKSNLSELDEVIVWGDLSICEFLTFIMAQDPTLDLSDAFNYFLNHAYLVAEIARARKGFAVWMTKTRKTITEAPQQFQPMPEKRGWLFWK